MQTDVRECWGSVRKILSGLQRDFFAEGVQVNIQAPKEAYNLPFVLDMVLTELLYQGVYACKGWDPSMGKYPPMLKKKMEASRTNMTWKDYDLVNEGRDSRNKVAHKAALVDKTECIKYVRAIEDEFKAWNLLN